MNNSLQTKGYNGSLIAVCLAALMFGFEISSVPVSLPVIEKELQGNFKDIQWIMNAYTIACCTVLMAAGTLADKYGRKRIFIYNVILFGITSLICGLAQNMPILIISRFLQGLSGGAMFICTIANLSNQFPDAKERAKAFSVWGVIVGVGLGFGPIIGSAIMTELNWRWIFLIHVPLSLITLLFGYRFIRESKDSNAQKLDIGGIILLAIAIFSLTYFIIQSPDAGFSSFKMIGVLLCSVASFIIFIWIEKKSSYPMFDFSVFKINTFSGAIMGSIGMNFSFWPFIIYLPILFQTGFGYSVIFTGICLLAYTLPSLVVPPLAEYLTLRYKAKVVIPTGLFLIGAGFLLMRYGCIIESASWKTLLGGMLVAGIGLGLTNTPVTNTATGSVSNDRVGMASGIDTSARLITLAINIAVMGLILINGIFHNIKSFVPGHVSHAELHTLAERIISGNNILITKIGVSAGHIKMVLVDAFSNVLLYGGLGVWGLSICSFTLFRLKKTDKTIQNYPVIN
ncbi:MFS transporter [Mucilaginibacter jinjuensis]|uniref:MFS transporter n=1 Tax=Mucilaginibacter jinjuensis TaxID=1176721 RepID=A0ABY7T258_9SPHI|nr:MFS transporter [Mucilaginibacter jinjuensis]WCT10333.1 MFS transporter [Mucilaginibacter jinjuensis]